MEQEGSTLSPAEKEMIIVMNMQSNAEFYTMGREVRN